MPAAHPPGIMNYSGLARAISEYKDSDPIYCTRLIPRTLQMLGLVKDDGEAAWFYETPPTTGDKRWDALIAGIATHTWALSGKPGVPDWTLPFSPLKDWWEPAQISPRWTFWNMVNTPASIRERKIIFPSAWLVAV